MLLDMPWISRRWVVNKLQYTNKVFDQYYHVVSNAKENKNAFYVVPRYLISCSKIFYFAPSIFLLIPHPERNSANSECLEPYLFTIFLKNGFWSKKKKVWSSSFLFQYYKFHFCHILGMDSLTNYFSFSFFCLLSEKWITCYIHYHGLFVNGQPFFYSGSW